MASDKKLGEFLAEVSNWEWSDFLKAEKDPKYTTNESIIFALIRSCAMEQMAAIRIALNRLDGKLKTPVVIEYPKVFHLYPNAKSIADNSEPMKKALSPGKVTETQVVGQPATDIALAPEEGSDLPSLSLRETLNKMSDYPRELPEAILQQAQLVEQATRGVSDMPVSTEIPKVKSVVAAHLLAMAQRRDIGALTEVFDQIDGRLAETIQIIGEDMYIVNYAPIAPEGAYLNEDGVLQKEAEQIQTMWAKKLGDVTPS